MTSFTKPMLAGAADLMQLNYPVAVSPKFDGIRVLIRNGVPVSRTLKPIRNAGIRKALTGLPSLLDGEIISVTNNFQDSTSAVMSTDSEIPWEYHIFDYVKNENLETPYSSRIAQLRELMELHHFPLQCRIVQPDYIYELSALEDVAKQHLEQGFEGTMIRCPAGRYKCGRSTKNEGLLLKLKQFEDTEAMIIGFEELLHNDNEATVNALGHTERSSSKEGKRQSGVLGAFVVQSKDDPEITYKVGSGLTAAQREQFWEQQDALMGQWVKVKYFQYGVKDKPRHPIFIGFRDPDDM